MRLWLVLVTTFLLAAGPAAATDPGEVSVYRTPTCGCCTKWVAHLEDHGFAVVDHVLPDLTRLKRENGVRPELASCHTAFVGGYVIEGHVPAADIRRLLATRPPVPGLAVPDMPIGSLWIEGLNTETYRVLSFDSSGNTETWSTHVP